MEKTKKKRRKLNGKNDGFAKNCFLNLSHKVKIASTESVRRARIAFCVKKIPENKTEEKNT